MGQLFNRTRRSTILKTTVTIACSNDLHLDVSGVYNPGESDVGLNESFEVTKIEINKGTLFSLIDWTEAQEGRAVVKIEELCIEKITD